MKAKKKKLTPEPFYEDAKGKRGDDLLHAEMLDDNEIADLAFMVGVIDSEIAMGRDKVEAWAQRGYIEDP